MRMSSTKVTIPVEAMVMALVDEAEPIVPASAINIALDVRLVIPVTTPASMLTAPSNTIAEPLWSDVHRSSGCGNRVTIYVYVIYI